MMVDNIGYYDKDGHPITTEQWGELIGDMQYKCVRRSKLDNDVEVSTVWLGLNHAFMGGPPLIFETMVFGGEHDGDMDRYSTLEQAINGHEAMKEKIK